MNDSVINKDMVTWLNSAETAEYLSISTGSLLNLVNRGLIPVYKLGRSNRYLKSEIDELLISTRSYGKKKNDPSHKD